MSATITRTLSWRFLRMGSSIVSSILGIACLFPAFMYGIIWLTNPNAAHEMRADTTGYTVLFAIAVWLIFPTLMVFACGFVRSLYALPLSSRRIVNTQLACGVVTLVGIYLVTVLFYRVVFGAALPIIGPVLVMGPMVVVATGCAALLVDFRWWRPFAVMGLFVVAVWYMDHRVTRSEVAASIDWMTPSFTEFASLIVIALLGYWLTFRGVSLDRSGELRKWPDFDAFWHRFSAKLSGLWRPPMATSPYRSPTSSQMWFEFWQKGLIVPALVAVPGGLSLFPGFFRPHDWLDGYLGAIMFLPMAMFVTGLIMGILNLGGKDMPLSQYRATRPLTDAQLASSVIKASLLSGVVMVGVISLYALVVYAWSWLHPTTGFRGGHGPRLSLSDNLMILTGSWTLTGLAASLMMCGRRWLITLTFSLLFGGFLLQPILRYFVPDLEQLDQLLMIGLIAVLFLATIGTIIAFTTAVRRKMISRRTTMAVSLLALIGVIAVKERLGPSDMQFEQWAYLIGGTCLAAAPLATAPLAVAWNRHR